MEYAWKLVSYMNGSTEPLCYLLRPWQDWT